MHTAFIIAGAMAGMVWGLRRGRREGNATSWRERLVYVALGGVIGGVGVALLPAIAGDIPETEWPDTVQHIETEAEMDAFVADHASDPALIGFHAPWCGPCRATAPALIQLASEGHPIALVDIDAAPALAEKYAVRATPSFLLFEQGKAQTFVVGAKTESELRALLR